MIDQKQIHFSLHKGIIWLYTLLLSTAGFAQNSTDSTLRQQIKEAARESNTRFQEHKIAHKQDALLEEIIRTIRNTRAHLKTGIDTGRINQELQDITLKYNIAIDGIFTHKGSLQTERNLTTSYKLLHELLNRAKMRKVQVDNYKRRLVQFRNSFDSLTSIPGLYAVSGDSAEFTGYLRKLSTTAQEMAPTDTILHRALLNVQHTKDKVDLVTYTLQSALDQIDTYEKELSRLTFEREVGSLDGPPLNARPFSEIIYQSIQKGKLSWLFYVRNNSGKLFILLLLTIFAVIFLRSLKQKVKNNGLLHEGFTHQLVLRYPVLSALMVVLNTFQFIFPDPPFVFSSMLWVVASGCLTIIFFRFITIYWMLFWMAIWLLFLCACGDNLLLQASRPERLIMLTLSVIGSLVCGWVLLKGDRKQLKERSIVYFIAFIILLECASIIANLYGRFNLAKSLMTSGFISVIIAIMFLWTVRLINEALTLASDVFKMPERNLFFINFEVVGKRAPSFFYVFLVIGWFILFARNFYAFKLITRPLEDFLFEQRSIGGYDFTLISVLAFFAILILSSIISKIVSFFASEAPHTQTDAHTSKPGIGSWILLIRIAIIVIGLLLAFSVAGIPLDKATFVMGALGVGIGFGLQSLVNNLVSGVILAFEKPLNVGDLVEVKGKTGTVRSIGFRSSILQTLEGSHLVIPNGELLNDELVNWNMNQSVRRNEILVGVAYNTDLKAARKVLLDLLSTNDHVLKYPEPAVFANRFGESSIEMQLFFWTPGLKSGRAVKSELILAIQEVFRTNGITIPFPQRDLHIRRENEDEKPFIPDNDR